MASIINLIKGSKFVGVDKAQILSAYAEQLYICEFEQIDKSLAGEILQGFFIDY